MMFLCSLSAPVLIDGRARARSSGGRASRLGKVPRHVQASVFGGSSVRNGRRSMTDLTTQAAGWSSESAREAEADRLVARSFYRQLRENGYTAMELLTVSIELIDLITHDLPEPVMTAARHHHLPRGNPMDQLISVVDLSTGMVANRESDTLTLDVPPGFDGKNGSVSVDADSLGRYRTVEGQSRVYVTAPKYLSLRSPGEECLVATAKVHSTGGAVGTHLYLLSLVELP
jgi:hypothetical protein